MWLTIRLTLFFKEFNGNGFFHILFYFERFWNLYFKIITRFEESQKRFAILGYTLVNISLEYFFLSLTDYAINILMQRSQENLICI